MPGPSGVVVATMNNRYAFHVVRGDRIRGGDKESLEGAVAYVGDDLAKHFVVSKDLDEVPEAVIEAVTEEGFAVMDGVDGGWASWDGRPEFSTTYVDVSDATVVAE